ncbi:MAG: shikimate kinase, partial [Bacteroidia bacterium]
LPVSSTGHLLLDTIVATGGGTACFNNSMVLMNEFGITVWLDAEIEDLYFNIIEDNPDRPLFNSSKKEELIQKLTDMIRLRKKFYEKSKVKLSIYRGLGLDLFTKRLHLSTFAK